MFQGNGLKYVLYNDQPPNRAAARASFAHNKRPKKEAAAPSTFAHSKGGISSFYLHFPSEDKISQQFKKMSHCLSTCQRTRNAAWTNWDLALTQCSKTPGTSQQRFLARFWNSEWSNLVVFTPKKIKFEISQVRTDQVE